MNDHAYPRAQTFYPQVANHIDNDPTPKDQAVYVPSVTPDYAIAAFEQQWKRPLPNGVHSGAFNFLDPANRDFFHISHVMSSAGQALNQSRDCIITKRDRGATTLICDSGGYQIASQRGCIDAYRDRGKILGWMELHADYAMTLDVPTGPVRKQGYPYKTTQDCLNETLDHLQFFKNNRCSSDLKLLNVLQGNNPTEADAWYDAVKGFEFEGWAFAGLLRHNMYEFCRRLIIMTKENHLQNKKWIHVLGACDLETAVLLTAVQRSINKYINPNLRISYDTSSPFRMLAYRSAYTIPKFETGKMTMPSRRAPDGRAYVGSNLRWPWPSPMGNCMTLGDFCVERHVTATSYHDRLSNYMLTHHNLSALCWGIALANRVFDSETVTRNHTIAQNVGAGVEAIDKVLEALSELQLAKYEITFRNLRHANTYDSGEDERPII